MNKSSLEYFAWARPIEGYAWEDSKILASKFLAPKPQSNDLNETRFLLWRDAASQAVSLTPLFDNAALFREFASLEPTEDAFLGFANQYGWLGVSKLLRGQISVTEAGKKQEVVNFGDRRSHGEPLWRWKAAHLNLWRVNGVLEAITGNDLTTLKDWFPLSPDNVRYERHSHYGEEWHLVCGASIKPHLWKWGHEGRTELERLKRFASVWAQNQINDALGSADDGTGTSVRVLVNDIKDAMSLHIVPDTLLGAMWLQCARVLTENPTFKACEHCGKWFELSAGARRKNSKFCSDRCKVAAYRARIPMTCSSCGQKFKVDVPAQLGFAYNPGPQDMSCPACGKVTNQLLPGEASATSIES